MKDCQIQLLSPLSAEERKIFMGLLSRLVEENNESSRTSLRPNGEAFLSAKPNDSRTARNKGKRKV
jgi:hypothetical protein